MKYNCFIVDDHKHDIDSIARWIAKMPDLVLVGFDTDPVVALNRLNSGTVPADIILLDIDMPDIGGIRFAREIGKRAIVIFITGHQEHALDAYGTEAVDYLLKPVDPALFLRAINRAKDRLQARTAEAVGTVAKDYIFIKLDSRNITQVELGNLVWIKSDNKYLDLHILGAKTLTINRSLNKTELALPADRFVRIHKSYIVNLKFVANIVGNRVILKDGQLLDIGSTYMETFYARLDLW